MLWSHWGDLQPYQHLCYVSPSETYSVVQIIRCCHLDVWSAERYIAFSLPVALQVTDMGLPEDQNIPMEVVPAGSLLQSFEGKLTQYARVQERRQYGSVLEGVFTSSFLTCHHPTVKETEHILPPTYLPHHS